HGSPASPERWRGPSAAVAELVLLAAAAEARLVAARRLLDTDRLLGNVATVRRDLALDGALELPVEVDDLLLGDHGRGRGAHRAGTGVGAVGSAVTQSAGCRSTRCLVDRDREVHHIGHEVVGDLTDHRFEHVEALALPFGERIALTHG